MRPMPAQPAIPTPSATAILVRQNKKSIELYLLRRSAESRFFPGFYVFPGGAIETEDRETSFWLRHVDLSADQLIQALDGPVEQMLPFAVSAIRETFEEAGLLMAAGAKRVPPQEPIRGSGRNFARQIADGALSLTISKLGRWSHWISPERMPQRFDTYFFVAPVDADQHCRPDNRETVNGIWIDPGKALAESHAGRLPLSPPTLVTLQQLLDFSDLDELMDAARQRPWPQPILPRMWPLERGALILEPWDPEYARERVNVDNAKLEKMVLPAGAPFSRIWLHQGNSSPVRCPVE